MYTRRRSSKAKWVLLLLAVLAAAGLAAWFVTPGAARPRLGEGDVVLRMEEDGTVLVTWPEAAPLSRVSVRSGEEKDARLLRELSGNSLSLDAALLDQPLHISVRAAARGRNLLGVERELFSRRSIDVTVQPYSTLTPVLTGEGSREPGELLLHWDGRGSYELGTLEGGRYQPLREVSGNSAALHFAEGGDLPLPSYDQPLQLTLRAIRTGEGYVLYGPCVEPLEVRRELLLGRDLSLELQELGERLYALRWNETKGDRYEVQEWSGGSWRTLARVERSEELRYETGLLRSGSDHRYRVISVGGDPSEPVEPAELSLRAEISTRYATVWPVVELSCFEDAGLTKALGKVPAGTALCVLEESGGAFQVRYRDQYVWVDSRFCLINLPEYVGDVCAYDITNSYSSIFMVHENPIQYITGEVVQGFEGVRTAEDGFLVPYLYPCAKKLLTAAQAAEKDGYRLRIYEAFRPNEATRFLYDTTALQLDYPVPVTDEETGEYVFYEPPEEPPVDPETGLPLDPETGLPVLPEDPNTIGMPAPQPEDGAPPVSPEDAGGSGEASDEPQLPAEDGETGLQEEPEAAPQPGPPAPEAPDPSDGADNPDGPPPEDAILFPGPSFRQIMTDNGRWRLGSFLAAVASAHNRGIALDLTIEALDGQPLEMQSAMHDLSWYSATYLNNDNARLLESYMTMPGVEMRGLSSEWWHFQDDDTREAIKLSSYLYKGVTAEGWTRDNIGWRYRDALGNYVRNTTRQVDGRQYAFDAQGYAAG